MTTLTREIEDQRKRITLEQIDEYDNILCDETAAISKVNGSSKITDDSRMAEVHGVEIRKAMLAMREILDQ